LPIVQIWSLVSTGIIDFLATLLRLPVRNPSWSLSRNDRRSAKLSVLWAWCCFCSRICAKSQAVSRRFSVPRQYMNL